MARQQEIRRSSRPDGFLPALDFHGPVFGGDVKVGRRAGDVAAPEERVLSPEISREDGAEVGGVHPLDDPVKLAIDARADEHADQASIDLVDTAGSQLWPVGRPAPEEPGDDGIDDRVELLIAWVRHPDV